MVFFVINANTSSGSASSLESQPSCPGGENICSQHSYHAWHRTLSYTRFARRRGPVLDKINKLLRGSAHWDVRLKKTAHPFDRALL